VFRLSFRCAPSFDISFYQNSPLAKAQLNIESVPKKFYANPLHSVLPFCSARFEQGGKEKKLKD
jgi:hypothetical protein